MRQRRFHRPEENGRDDSDEALASNAAPKFHQNRSRCVYINIKHKRDNRQGFPRRDLKKNFHLLTSTIKTNTEGARIIWSCSGCRNMSAAPFFCLKTQGTKHVVGGCVRDLYMGVELHDYDITTSATPEAVKDVFRGERIIDTGIRHGTVTLVVEDGAIEITTYRKR